MQCKVWLSRYRDHDREKVFFKTFMLVKVIFEKPYIFQKSIFKKMPPDTPRNRIRDLSGASLLVVKGFPTWCGFRARPHDLGNQLGRERVHDFEDIHLMSP